MTIHPDLFIEYTYMKVDSIAKFKLKDSHKNQPVKISPMM